MIRTVNRTRRVTAALGGIAIATLALSACTEDQQVPAESGGDETIESVALMVQDAGNPFFAAMTAGVEAAAEELGATFTAQDGRQDLATQNEQIDAFIQQGLDILLINAVDSEGIGPAVQRAVDAGITVVAVDVTATNAQATVTTDNVKAGELACQALVDGIGGEGDILIVDGTPISSIQDRMTGCQNVLDEYPDVEVVGHQNGNNGRDEALTLTTDMLTATPDVVGIFGVNDPTALGAILAAQQAGKTDLVVTGVDGSPDAVEEMQQPDTMFQATAAQDPAGLGRTGLEMAVKLRQGEELEEDLILVEPSLVTVDTIGEYEGWQG